MGGSATALIINYVGDRNLLRVMTGDLIQVLACPYPILALHQPQF